MAYPPTTKPTVSEDTMMEMPAIKTSSSAKGGIVTVASIDSKQARPILGRRRTTVDGVNVESSAKLSYDGEEDTLTKIGDFLYKIHSFSIFTKYALYVLPVAAILAIPLVLADTVYYHVRVGPKGLRWSAAGGSKKGFKTVWTALDQPENLINVVVDVVYELDPQSRGYPPLSPLSCPSILST